MNKKKIGILTLHSAHNYGAVLQAYALQNILNKEYNCEIINFKNKEIEKAYSLLYIDNTSLKTRIKSILIDLFFLPQNIKRRKNFNKFINNNLKLSDEKYNNEKDFDAFTNKYDVLITGSDQVWNPEITNGLNNAYTLNFNASNAKKISYAASIGKIPAKENDINEFSQKIEIIDKISVRENTAKDFLSKIIDKDIAVTIDPTLLCDKSFWDNLTVKQPLEKSYVFGYIIGYDDNYINVLNKVSEISGFNTIHCARRNKNIKRILQNSYTAGPLEFLNQIKNAEYVVTTSFHATVFSIIFNKKFFYVPNLNSDRVTSLLEKLGLSDRCVASSDIINKQLLNKDIDYNLVEEKLKTEILHSLQWLNNAIENK